jgi:hypothetical protein
MPRIVLTLVATAMILLTGFSAWQADAQTWRGAGKISTAQNYTPTEKAACRGWGPWCGPGFTRVCGPYRCWCRPCW